MINPKFWLGLILTVLIFSGNTNGNGVEVYNPYFHFPPGSPYMGIFVAVAIPLNNRGLADVFFSMNFEASYSLPQNQTQFVFPPIITDTVTRKFVYNMVESNIQSYGVPGKPCLLRAICEAAEFSTQSTGVLGDLLHILLTPSSSKNDDPMIDYAEAEEYGKNKKHCKKYSKKCSLSVLNLVSKLDNKYFI
ncbi:uncharacterized protein LOC108910280 [Anoplophora glabripennis]|uniref:uncharacterized protein LOC108910280 n=1 Tax=Anoplophora glabripennis TaxID=217634 RepID=UPI000C78AD9D|nr:uncharacterized protein LOC108910280 [Anoplophora glabripennis]